MSDLIERLRAAEAGHAAARENFLTMQGAAAKLLEDANSYKAAAATNLELALIAEARISELEGALRPFVQLLEASEASAQQRGLVPDKIADSEPVVHFKIATLTIGDFRTARQALGAKP